MTQQTEPSTRHEPRSPIVPLIQRAEQATALDPVADRLEPFARATISSDALRGLLRGDWLGHAVHPMLTDVPIGAWISTNVLDLVGGRRSRGAAEGLLALGLAAAVPTALTGAAEWAATSGEHRRVGVLHAAFNVTALGFYGASLVARRRGEHWRGVGLGLLGTLAASAGGYLGAHLTIVGKVGSSDPAFGTGGTGA